MTSQPPNLPSAPQPPTEIVNTTQLAGILRIIIPALLSYWGAKLLPSNMVGPVTENIINVVVAVVTLGATIWSFYSNKKSTQINRVASMENVAAVITTPHMADVVLVNNPRVVSTSNVSTFASTTDLLKSLG